MGTLHSLSLPKRSPGARKFTTPLELPSDATRSSSLCSHIIQSKHHTRSPPPIKEKSGLRVHRIQIRLLFSHHFSSLDPTRACAFKFVLFHPFFFASQSFQQFFVLVAVQDVSSRKQRSKKVCLLIRALGIRPTAPQSPTPTTTTTLPNTMST